MRLRAHHPSMQVSPDILPGHPLSVCLLLILLVVGSLFNVSRDLVTGAAILFAVNSVVTFIWAYRNRELASRDLIESVILRGVTYVALGIGVVVFSNMSGLVGEQFRSVIFSGMAATELLFTAHLAARMFERFRPLYLYFIQRLDDLTMIDFGSDDVKEAMNGNDQSSDSNGT